MYGYVRLKANFSLVMSSSVSFEANGVCLDSHAVRKLSASCFIWGVIQGLELKENFFQRFDCYCGICAEINLVHNDSEPVIQVPIKEVSACQGILELYDGIL